MKISTRSIPAGLRRRGWWGPKAFFLFFFQKFISHIPAPSSLYTPRGRTSNVRGGPGYFAPSNLLSVDPGRNSRSWARVGPKNVHGLPEGTSFYELAHTAPRDRTVHPNIAAQLNETSASRALRPYA